MSTANGALTPPPAPQHPEPQNASPSAAKRKRSTSQANALTDRQQPAQKSQPAQSDARTLKALLEDVLDILKSYDTTPSILDQQVRSNGDRAVSGEPTTKRTKLAQLPSAGASIAEKVQADAYASLDDLVADVESVCSQLLASINAQNASSEADTKLITGTLAFKKVLKNIVIRETHRKAAAVKAVEEEDDTVDDDDKAETNGVIKKEPVDEEVDSFSSSRAVLTLFASAQGNKQLFSSLQKPVKVEGKTKTEAVELDSAVHVTLPLDESGLPSMISTTKIIPVHTEDAIGGKSKGPTFGDVFGPPPKFRDLKPPVPASQTTNKGNTITWGQQDLTLRTGRRGSSYSSQKLTTGDWLGYSGLDVEKEPSSPSAKRKQRDRALSTGEVNPPLPDEEQAKLDKARADALFRSIYSSFAPTHDDGVAVVPEETKNRVWWQKVGEKRFNEVFALDPALLDAQPGEAMEGVTEENANEDETFKEAAEQFEPEELKTSEKSEQDKEDQEIDELLQEISELLETLHSYQRIRHSTLAPSTRAPAGQDTAVQPSAPSTDELDIYGMLKTQLSLMVSQLPPYAVAKLNGDQLEDLNISKKLVIETKDYRGVMEEDQVSKLAKSAAIGATVGAPAVRPPGAHYPPANQYGRTPTAPQYASRPVGGPPSYYPQQGGPARTPSIPRYPSQGYQTPGAYASAAQRPSYGGPAYAQTPRQPSYGAAASTYGQAPHSYYRGPPAGYGMAPSYYQSTPQGAAQNRYMQPGSAYPPRTQGAAPMYNYTATGSPQVRTASPLKQGQPGAGQTPYPQQRPPSGNPYGTPAHQQSQRPSYYPHTPYGTSSQPAQTLTPSANASYHASIQAHARATLGVSAAQANMARASSGTPQPPGSSGSGGQTQFGGQSQGQGQGSTTAVAS